MVLQSREDDAPAAHRLPRPQHPRQHRRALLRAGGRGRGDTRHRGRAQGRRQAHAAARGGQEARGGAGEGQHEDCRAAQGGLRRAQGHRGGLGRAEGEADPRRSGLHPGDAGQEVEPVFGRVEDEDLLGEGLVLGAHTLDARRTYQPLGLERCDLARQVRSL